MGGLGSQRWLRVVYCVAGERLLVLQRRGDACDVVPRSISRKGRDLYSCVARHAGGLCWQFLNQLCHSLQVVSESVLVATSRSGKSACSSTFQVRLMSITRILDANLKRLLLAAPDQQHICPPLLWLLVTGTHSRSYQTSSSEQHPLATLHRHRFRPSKGDQEVK